MLRDVFPHLLDGDYLESATIWECSRICVGAAHGQPERDGGRAAYVLSELILGIGEVAVAAGLTQIVAVFDARMLRVLKAVGCNPEIIGTPRPIGDVMCYAALFDTGEGQLKAFRAATGIDDSVLRPAPRKSPLHDERRPPQPKPAARRCCAPPVLFARSLSYTQY